MEMKVVIDFIKKEKEELSYGLQIASDPIELSWIQHQYDYLGKLEQMISEAEMARVFVPEDFK